MYVKTKGHKIINISHFHSIEVSGTPGNFKIQAVRSSSESDRALENIAGFNEKVDADYALHDLFMAIADGKAAWNVNTIKSLSAPWSKVKTDNESLPILEGAEISVTDSQKLVIAYPSTCKGYHNLEDQKGQVKSQLITALGQKIEIDWKPCDDLNSNA